VKKAQYQPKRKKRNGKEEKWKCECRMDLWDGPQIQGVYNVQYFYLEVNAYTI
jgi:hypothetical protein